MNIRRGLFRLWLVASALWLVIVIALSWETVISPYLYPEQVVAGPGSSTATGRIDTSGPEWQTIGGDAPADYSGFKRVAPTGDEKLSSPSGAFEVRSGSETFDVPAPDLATAIKATTDRLARSALLAVEIVAGVAAGPPLVVLLLGSALVWAFAGFARRR